MRLRRFKKGIVLSILTVLGVTMLGGNRVSAGDPVGSIAVLTNSSNQTIKVDHYTTTYQGDAKSTRTPADSYMASTPNVVTFLDASGRLNVAAMENKKLVIRIYDTNGFQMVGQLAFASRLSVFGNVTVDASGNYYVVWAQPDSNNENLVTMCITKYNASGTLIGELQVKGHDSKPLNNVADTWGTQVPFKSGNCDLAIQNGVLAVNYARQMYNGSQSNMILYVNMSNMTRMYGNTAFTSHSFDQRIYAAKDGKTFLALNQGDANARSFRITKISKVEATSADQMEYDGQIDTFHFREGAAMKGGYNYTYAQLGGLAETDNAYVFAGSSERILSLDQATATGGGHNGARDLFIQILKKEFNAYSNAGCYHFSGETRRTQGTKPANPATNLYLSGNEVDYGVVWLTNYDEDHYVANPKIVSVGANMFAVLWEKRAYYGSDISTYFAVMDSSGKVVRNTIMLTDTLLSADTDPVFKDGKIMWATVDDHGARINVLDVNAKTESYHEHQFEEISRNGNKVTLKCSSCGFITETITTSNIMFYLGVNGEGYMWSARYEQEAYGLKVNSGDQVNVYITVDNGSTDVIQTEISNGEKATFEDGNITKNGKELVIFTKMSGKVKVTIKPLYVSNPVTKTFYLDIAGTGKADGPAAPTGLQGVGVSAKGFADGRITGVSDQMEYSVDADFSKEENIHKITGNEIRDLAAGNYYVRIAETDTTQAGRAALVVVADSDQIIAVKMYRLYNPNSGEHFYTAKEGERDILASIGWSYEGEAWTAPSYSNTPVYRMYNPNAGDHHYTLNTAERDMLMGAGWNYEGIGWYSDDAQGEPLYRLYNPNAVAGAHHYTTNAAERDLLVGYGWQDEGIGWYGIK